MGSTDPPWAWGPGTPREAQVRDGGLCKSPDASRGPGDQQAWEKGRRAKQQEAGSPDPFLGPRWWRGLLSQDGQGPSTC